MNVIDHTWSVSSKDFFIYLLTSPHENKDLSLVPVKSISRAIRTLISGTEWYNFPHSILFNYNSIFDILFIVIILSCIDETLGKKQIILFFSAYLLVSIFIYAAAFSWTDISNRLIWGLQERYFFPVICPLFISIQQLAGNKFKVNKSLMAYLTGCCTFISLAMQFNF